MRKYSVVSPSIDGLLSDDFLYFEGLSRPSEILFIKDGGIGVEKSLDILEKYLNDVYNLFLRKVSYFMSSDHMGDEEAVKMQALLQEMIKVKQLIRDADESKMKS